MPLKDSKYDGNGGLWVNHNSHGAKHPVMQGSMQIGGRTIALTIWKGRGNPAPDYNITVNEQKTSFEDMVWFKALSDTDDEPITTYSTKTPPTVKGKQVDAFEDDIPF